MRSRGFEVVKKYQNAQISLPERKTKGSAGYDISCAVDIIVKKKTFEFVPTGIKAYMLEDEVLEVYPRSSLSFKKKLVKLNSVGIIDSDYYNNPDNEGEIMLILYNYGDEDVLIKKGERIAQGIFMKYLTVDSDDTKVKRLGGFGSTGN
ncbi:MAG: deoxyuridine 5'-triphosphate nucleotidohydrolase [Ignavibacteriae bacterium HGW-Ignavibacteriae-4]|jgi:dUTP pyrophosphatase|nr:MAG: deoxyuridine 5'-triphosphate nucleotidohydrolase [Ignavibacteriae bacterium HGW-Ignavibacteriae-4]